MASLSEQKPQRPAYSNWFYSLRRNKHKKPSAKSHITKDAQRSCIDLSANNSVFYLNPTLEDKQAHTLPYNEITSISTEHICAIEKPDNRARALTISNFCSPCCCAGKSAALLNNTKRQVLPTKYETLQEANDLTSAPAAATETADNVVTLVSKRADFLRTTTVTTTRTLIITRPVEVLLNAQGEVLRKRDVPTDDAEARHSYAQRRANSLDCILNERLEESNAPLAGVRPGVLASCDDLQYIDENVNNNNLYNEQVGSINQTDTKKLNQHNNDDENLIVIMRNNSKV